jgi:hypothetical protein
MKTESFRLTGRRNTIVRKSYVCGGNGKGTWVNFAISRSQGNCLYPDVQPLPICAQGAGQMR